MHRIIELEISSYALMTAIGIIVAVFFIYCRSEVFKMKTLELVIYSAVAVVGMAVGSRVVFIISQIPSAIEHGSISVLVRALTSGGFVFYGGLFGAIFAVWMIGKVRNFDPNGLMNYYIPGFPVFHFFGRIGCLLAGCCYGIPVEWGIIQPAVDSYARLPVQLFESVYNLIIVVAMMVYESRARKKNKPYSLLTLYLAMYAPFRFINEFFRDDTLRGKFGPLSTSQWISLIVIGALISYLAAKKIKSSSTAKDAVKKKKA